MDATSVRQYITQTFPGVEYVEAMGGTFFFVGQERKLPFATLVTGDEHDQASDLSRPGVFRLNVGVGKETFRSLFGGEAEAGGGHDFTALDRIMPHPVYGKMYWVCVLNPGEATFKKVQELLAEAYQRAARKGSKTGPGGEAEPGATPDRGGTPGEDVKPG
jgi:Family of unknown function (DUF6194)